MSIHVKTKDSAESPLIDCASFVRPHDDSLPENKMPNFGTASDMQAISTSSPSLDDFYVSAQHKVTIPSALHFTSPLDISNLVQTINDVLAEHGSPLYQVAFYSNEPSWLLTSNTNHEQWIIRCYCSIHGNVVEAEEVTRHRSWTLSGLFNRIREAIRLQCPDVGTLFTLCK